MTSFIAIEKLLTSQRDKHSPVSLRGDAALDWHNWLSSVASWRQVLEQRDEQRWALYHQDSHVFSAILFALWSLGKTACLPGNCQPALIESLKTEVDAFVGDFDGLVDTLPAPATQTVDADQLAAFAHTPLDSNKVLLQIYTSGSSGKPQLIPKTIGQLSAEVTHLQQLWGKQLASTLVVATVSHQHIYGLLFRVLWPLSAGVCFDTQTCEYLEDIQPRADRGWALALVSSPTHLSRIPPTMDQIALQQLRCIFSSGAPLKREDSLLANNRLGTAVLEVYGSTETGGIAWRQQSPQIDALWQAMPGVQVRIDTATECLELRSEHLADSTSWQLTPDRVRLDEQGQFTLLGRADRIVKAEGKRTSLDEMEATLLQHSAVDAVRLLMLEGKRTEIAGIVVLSSTGAATLASKGKRQLNEILRSHCLQRFERPVLPRRWRYVAQLPVNAQGKFERQVLLKLFQKKSASQPRLPTVLNTTSTASGQIHLQLHVPEDLLFFDGHFDKVPILPGVVQVHWAEHYARQNFSLTEDFLRLEVIKFKQIINPGHQISLALSYEPTKGKISFVYSSATGEHASGHIVLDTAK